MTPLDLMRWQMAAAFGMLDLQRRMMSGAWQVGLWWLPKGVEAPEAAPKRGRKARG